MIARFAGAGLGLFAFSVTVIAGLWVQNPFTVTLSRGILALFVFCLIGLAVGAAAQVIVQDHVSNRESTIRQRYPKDTLDTPDAVETGRKEPSDGGAEEGDDASRKEA